MTPKFKQITLALLLVLISTLLIRSLFFGSQLLEEGVGAKSIDVAIAAASEMALNRGVPNWVKVRESAFEIFNKNRSSRDLDDAIRYIGAVLEDPHTIYLPSYEPRKLMAADEISTEISTVKHDGSAPVLEIRGFLGMESQLAHRAAEQVRANLTSVLNQTHCGLVLDLTKNTGGNMYPMIAGVLPLLNKGNIGYFENADGELMAIRNENDSLYLDAVKYMGPIAPPNLTTDRKPMKRIALIVGENTGSSGEMLAAVFLGQKNVRYFGKETAGFTTGNHAVPLPNGGILALPTSRFLDRNKKRVSGTIKPDEVVSSWSIHTARSRAEKWIQQACQ